MEDTQRDNLQEQFGPEAYTDEIISATIDLFGSADSSAVGFTSNLDDSRPADELVASATPRTSVEVQTRKSDPFTTMNDGHFVGHDGFVVPRDFEEFNERFPNYAFNWVRRHADRFATKEDLEDWTQDLLTHFSRLSPKSKYRNAGKTDVVQTFDPVKHHGANAARFWNYVNRCLANKFSTMRSKRMNDALCRPGNLSFDIRPDAENLRSVDDEYCHSHSEYLREAARTSEEQAHKRARLQEFKNFVQREDPKALPAIDALFETGRQGEAANSLGITQREFGRILGRLKQLGKCFLSGEPVPKQRRPNKTRIVKARQFAASRVAA